MKHNWFVKVRNTITDRYKLIFTPKFSMEFEARDFVKKQAGYDKYDDVIVEICAIVDLR